jgi:hypothetical protein
MAVAALTVVAVQWPGTAPPRPVVPFDVKLDETGAQVKGGNHAEARDR